MEQKRWTNTFNAKRTTFKYKKTSLKQNKQTSKENQQIPMKTVTFQKSYLVIFTYFPKQINIS